MSGAHVVPVRVRSEIFQCWCCSSSAAPSCLPLPLSNFFPRGRPLCSWAAGSPRKEFLCLTHHHQLHRQCHRRDHPQARASERPAGRPRIRAFRIRGRFLCKLLKQADRLGSPSKRTAGLTWCSANCRVPIGCLVRSFVRPLAGDASVKLTDPGDQIKGSSIHEPAT